MTQINFSKPFALSMGPQRAATSWIDQYLRSRGDVCLPHQVKEIFFFDRHFDKGPDFYKSHFKPEPEHDLIMEVSATYFDCPEAPERIRETLVKDIHLICPLREPVARSYSLYKHYLRYGIVSGTLEEAIEQKPQIIESSRYAEHLARWFDVFGRENITILFQEELDQDPESFIRKLCVGLGIEEKEADLKPFERVNQTTQHAHPKLAAMAQNGADWFRNKGVYWPVNLAKSIGLKRVVFGKDAGVNTDTEVPEEEIRVFHDALKKEKRKLEDLLEEKIKLWDS